MESEPIEFGVRKYRIGLLRLPGDWQRILDSPAAQEQAESIRRVGLIHHPVVRRSDRLLICGHTRIAGLVILGETHVNAKVIECSDEHVEAMRAEENSERTHDPEAQRMAREAREERIVEVTQEIVDAGVENRSEWSVKAEARGVVAEEAGIKRKSLHQSDWRERERQKKLEAEQAALLANPVNDRGMEMDPAFLVQLGLVRKRVNDAKAKVTSAVTTLRTMKTQGLPFSHGVIDELVVGLQIVAKDIAIEAPRTLCYYCRALRGVVEGCADCKSTGWMSSRACEDAGEIPHALADDENPAVMYRGEIVTVDAYLEANAPEEPEEPEEDLDALWS